MPVITWTALDLREHGPLAAVTVSSVTRAQDAMRAAGRAVPAPTTVTGLIDTGCIRSAIDRGLAGRLGLQPVGSTLISTPTSAGGVRMPTHAIQMALTGQGNSVSFDTVTVVEAQIADQSIGLLIGRDVLASAAFMYVGQSGQCTLAF